MGPERDIDDPALQRMKLGPDVEPSEGELLKAPPERGDVAATGGPATPETGLGAARRLGLRGLWQILGPGLITGASDDDPSGIGTYSQAGAQFGFGVVHPPAEKVLIATFVPHLEFNKAYITTLVAILGTTISPYLFFWQASSEVDEMKAAGQRTERERKGVTRNEMRAARIDVFVGMAFSQVVMFAIILVSAAAFNSHGVTVVATADQAAKALEPLAGPLAFVLFAAGFMGTGLLAIPVLSGSAAYALAEFAGVKGNLAEKAKYRPAFYSVIVAATAVGVALNLFGINMISALFYTAVINGVVAPPLMILIAMLGSDKKVMQKRTSRRVSFTLVWIATGGMTIAALLLIVTLVPHGPLS